MFKFAEIPIHWVGPIKIANSKGSEDISVPLATLESPLWPSTNRGARATRRTDGIYAEVIRESMSRSSVVEAPSLERAYQISHFIKQHHNELQIVVASTSRYANLESIETEVVGNLLYLRFSYTTGDASGHNMVTKASEALVEHILKLYPDLKYVSLSANYCTDKKVSAVNGILGRGKYVVAETLIPENICLNVLKTTPEALVDLHIKKNLLGSILAGSLRSANAHFSNILLALYLATGQDAANIIEGSQGIVHTETRGRDLYFSVTLPNLIVGTTGSGKQHEFAHYNLAKMGCLEENDPGVNARRLSRIIASTVLCGEISLLAALTNKGELVKAHMKLERSA